MFNSNVSAQRSKPAERSAHRPLRADRACASRLDERPAFTLIELLVVIGIIGLLMAVLLPALGRARQQSMVVRAHAELRQISIALHAYALDNRDQLPPARCACGTNVNYQLPIELAEGRYLPESPSKIPQSHVPDVFAPQDSYKYRAPGPIYQNGTFFDFPSVSWRPRARIWVPGDFPRCAGEAGRWYAARDNEPNSPVRYAVWSVGPNPASSKFPRQEGSDDIDDSLFPLPRRFWLMDRADEGLIVHYQDARGLTYMWP